MCDVIYCNLNIMLAVHSHTFMTDLDYERATLSY